MERAHLTVRPPAGFLIKGRNSRWLSPRFLPCRCATPSARTSAGTVPSSTVLPACMDSARVEEQQPASRCSSTRCLGPRRLHLPPGGLQLEC